MTSEKCGTRAGTPYETRIVTLSSDDACDRCVPFRPASGGWSGHPATRTEMFSARVALARFWTQAIARSPPRVLTTCGSVAARSCGDSGPLEACSD